jgi:hypothetical protein
VHDPVGRRDADDDQPVVTASGTAERLAVQEAAGVGMPAAICCSSVAKLALLVKWALMP